MGTLLKILQLIPSLIEIIKAIEGLVPAPGNGKAKLDTVLGIVQDVYPDAAALTPQITGVVGKIVTLANTTGAFKN